MTNDEIIAKAVEHLRRFETHFGDAQPPELRQLSVDDLPKRRVGSVREIVQVYFECDDNQGKIEVSLDYRTGECLEAKFVPPTGKATDEKP
jgi:hypothetical protein